MRKIIIGNWKMNPLRGKEAEKLFSEVARSLTKIKKTEIVICPPFVFLDKLSKIRTNKIKLGAQNAFSEEVGAYTGEVSAEMLGDLEVKYVILGHSERRSRGETNQEINKKIKVALSAGLLPILCVGETERNENHEYFQIVKNQILECLNGINKNLISKIIVAYEPVWALSTTPGRRDATPDDSREMSVFIQKVLSDKFGIKTKLPRILYGGSLNDKNCEDFLKNGEVDGCLSGAASLSPEKFLKIISVAESIS